jgi:hypothetical protein
MSESPGLNNLANGFLELNPGSRAIDATPCLINSYSTLKDIRGQDRPAGLRCDIGADEYIPAS